MTLPDRLNDDKYKHFYGCIGALDDTHAVVADTDENHVESVMTRTLQNISNTFLVVVFLLVIYLMKALKKKANDSNTEVVLVTGQRRGWCAVIIK